MEDKVQPCLWEIFNNGREVSNPILQVVQIMPCGNKDNGGDRYKLALNDGTYFCPCLLATQLSGLITNNELVQNQLVKLTHYAINDKEGKKTVIALDLEVLPDIFDAPIGNPTNIAKSLSKDVKPKMALSEPSRNAAPPQPPTSLPIAPPKPQKPRSVHMNQTNYLPISSLTAYITSWTIHARVVQKSAIRQWSNQRGNGKLFSITLRDQQGGEIKGTFFNDDVDKFYDNIILDHIYDINGGRLKPANAKFASVKHEYEITFNSSSSFIETGDDDGSIGELSYDFCKLKDIENKEIRAVVDILAIVVQVDDIQELHSTKTNKDLIKRTLLLADDSSVTIECTLWNEAARDFPSNAQDQVIRIKDAKIGEFRGKNLSISDNSLVKILDSSNPEAARLLNWWEVNKENSSHFEQISSGNGQGDYNSRVVFLEEVNNMTVLNGKSEGFTFYGVLAEINVARNLYYLACPRPECKNKGVTQTEGAGSYICPTCKAMVSEPVPRYAFSARLSDFTGAAYFSILGEEPGTILVGCSAKDWKDETEGEEEKEKRAKILPRFFTQYKIKARAKTENYNNEERVKLYVNSLTEIDYAEAAKFYASEIRRY